MERDGFERWLDGYFAAWISNDADDVAALFVEDAVYSVGPFAAAWTGRDEIVVAGSAGLRRTSNTPTRSSVEGDTGIAHWNVKATSEGQAARGEWDGILWITFAPDGRCREHREWLVRRELPPD